MAVVRQGNALMFEEIDLDEFDAGEDYSDTASAIGGVLGLMAGIATYAVSADPSKQGEVFGDGWMKRFGEGSKGKSQSESDSDNDAAKGLGEAAKSGDSKSFIKHYKRLTKPLRVGLHLVSRSIKSGAATVDQYNRALKRVAKGASWSLKRSVTKTIHEALSQHKLRYTGDQIKFTTARGKKIKMYKGRAFALAKRKIGSGYYLQTYHPRMLNIIPDKIGNILDQNSMPRSEKANKRDGKRANPRR